MIHIELFVNGQPIPIRDPQDWDRVSQHLRALFASVAMLTDLATGRDPAPPALHVVSDCPAISSEDLLRYMAQLRLRDPETFLALNEDVQRLGCEARAEHEARKNELRQAAERIWQEEKQAYSEEIRSDFPEMIFPDHQLAIPITAELMSELRDPAYEQPPFAETRIDDLSVAAIEPVASPPSAPEPAVDVPKRGAADPDELLNTSQVAAQSGLTRDTIAWHIREGNLVPTQRADNRDPLRRCNLYSPAEVARFLQARKEKTRPPAPDVAAPAPKAVTEAPAEPVPEAPRAPSPPEASLTLPPRPEPEMPRVAQAIEIRQRERRESVRLDRAIEAGRTQFHPAFVLCSREGDDGREYHAFSSARAAETENVGWIVVCRYQKNGLGRWEEIGDGVGAPGKAQTHVSGAMKV